MRIGPHLWLSLLLVTGGLLVYDVLQGPGVPPPTPFDPSKATEPLNEDPAPRQLARIEALVEVNSRRIAAFERELDDLRRRRVLADAGGDDAERPPEPTPLRRALPRGGETAFDEETLASLRAYLEELERRKHLEVERGIIASELLRQELGLTQDQQRDVVATTVEYRARARDLMRRTWPPGQGGQAERHREVMSLRREYRLALGRLVSAYDAERIMQSPVAPGQSKLRGSEQPSDGQR